MAQKNLFKKNRTIFFSAVTIFALAVFLAGVFSVIPSRVSADNLCEGTNIGSCDSNIGQCQYPDNSSLICGSPTNCRNENLWWGPTYVCITICDCMMYQPGILVTDSYCGAVGMTGTYACQSSGPVSASCEVPVGEQTDVIGAMTAGDCPTDPSFPDDTGKTNSPPTITLNGSSFMTVPTDQPFSDPWATASDAEDGNLTSRIFISSGFVDVNTVASYTLTYTVTDLNGASASVSRTVVPDPSLNSQTSSIGVSLSASPTSITAPNSSILSWTTTGTPDSCSASGDWSGSKSVSGGTETKSFTTAGTYNYTLTCHKSGLSDATSNASVTVSGQQPTVQLSANPTTGTSPLNSTITWSSTNATSCVKQGGWSGSAATSGSQAVVVASQTAYFMTCSNAYGSDTKSVTITPTSGSGGGGKCSITVNNTYGGTVASNDGKISCGASCSQSYTCGTPVVLSATPASSRWKFIGWTGDCSGTGTCTLNVGANYTTSAIFVPNPFNYKEF
jgi:hypothetical protein